LRKVIIAATTLGLVVLGAAAASASPTPGGSATVIAAPPSVLEHALVSMTAINVFFESETVLPGAQSVDDSAAGTFDDYDAFSASTIASGTCVDSWFMQFDPGGLPKPLSAQSDGSMTFDTQILGVEALDSSLDATDYLGASGTTYPTGITASERGMEVLHAPSGFVNRSGNPDEFSINAAMTSVSVHMDTGAHFDQFRVLTACNPTVTKITAQKTYPAGVPVQLQAKVAASSMLPPTPAGQVQFLVDGVSVGTVTLSAKGKASILVSALGPGKHTAQAVYLGNPPTDSPSKSKVKKFSVV
jgi:hypothetical protein